ncbi:MvdC/MvdD family ATP grasp protein [Carbonactinospora thermoautotrophica]|uniref:MvdC/MvdD family ATP grasp protein n=1 Tax=Carbonactinospora thermoautotrophica TaxID=1469144 RepID=UPI001E5E46AA|nr:ATP-grasp ribosomal peptide maturase [Carbonactinospora thermoautotrophica]
MLVLTNRYDPTADLVVQHLNERGVPVFRCDTAEFPMELTLSAVLDDAWAGTLTTPHRRVNLTEIRSVYYRRPEEFRLPQDMPEAGRQFAVTQCRAGFLGVVGSLPCLWVNHPARDSDANYKPWQLAVARRVGLNPPRTVITNNPEAARRFAESRNGPVITKSLGGGVLDGKVRRGTETTIVDPATFDDSIRLCAHLFQEWIDKAHEVRLTVVDDRFFRDPRGFRTRAYRLAHRLRQPDLQGDPRARSGAGRRPRTHAAFRDRVRSVRLRRHPRWRMAFLRSQFQRAMELDRTRNRTADLQRHCRSSSGRSHH